MFLGLEGREWWLPFGYKVPSGLFGQKGSDCGVPMLTECLARSWIDEASSDSDPVTGECPACLTTGVTRGDVIHVTEGMPGALLDPGGE